MPLSDNELLAELNLSKQQVEKLMKTFQRFKDDIELTYPAVPVFYDYKVPEVFGVEARAPIFLDYSKKSWDVLSLNTLQTSYKANLKRKEEIKDIEDSGPSGIAYILENPPLNHTELNLIFDSVLATWQHLIYEGISDSQMAYYHGYLTNFDEFIYDEILDLLNSNEFDEYAVYKECLEDFDETIKPAGYDSEAPLSSLEQLLKSVDDNCSVLNEEILPLKSSLEQENTKSKRSRIFYLEQQLTALVEERESLSKLTFDVRRIESNVNYFKVQLKAVLPSLIIASANEINNLNEFESVLYSRGLLGLTELTQAEKITLIEAYIDDFSASFFDKDKLDARNVIFDAKDKGLLCSAYYHRFYEQSGLKDMLISHQYLYAPLSMATGSLTREKGPQLQDDMLKSFKLNEDLVTSDPHLAIELRKVSLGQDFFDVLLAIVLNQTHQPVDRDIVEYIKEVREGTLEIAHETSTFSPLYALLSQIDCLKHRSGKDRVFMEEGGEKVRKMRPRPSYEQEIKSKLVSFLRGSDTLELSAVQTELLSVMGIKPVNALIHERAKEAIFLIKKNYEEDERYKETEPLQLKELTKVINHFVKSSSKFNAGMVPFLNEADTFTQHYVPTNVTSQKILADLFKEKGALFKEVLKVVQISSLPQKQLTIRKIGFELECVSEGVFERKRQNPERSATDTSMLSRLFFFSDEPGSKRRKRVERNVLAAATPSI